MSVPMTIVIACGGTGGHVFPGMATGQVLLRRGHTVHLWLSGQVGVEDNTLYDWSGPVFRTGARPLKIAFIPAFLFSLWRVWRELRRLRPDVLLAMGSYSSIPPVLAAHFLGIPVVLHEANAVPGRAVALLSRFARATAVAFKSCLDRIYRCRAVYTGMPVRNTLVGQPSLGGYERGVGFGIMITGGSLGAHAVNILACEAICLLQRQGMPGLRVIHQCGTIDESFLRARYIEAGVVALVSPFMHEMGRAYASVDLAICRAGSATCAELCLCGLPAILIPLPTAIRDHQRLNAESMFQAGGARMFEQADLTPQKLADCIAALRGDIHELQKMRQALLALAVPDAASALADLLEKSARSDSV